MICGDVLAILGSFSVRLVVFSIVIVRKLNLTRTHVTFARKYISTVNRAKL